jgi:DNA-binding CsgD family transcriptional regulator
MTYDVGLLPSAAEHAQAVAYLIVVNFPEWNAPILRSEQVIGRGEEAAICVPARFRSISRTHAEVWADERGRLWIRDLGSLLGTAINGVPLHPEQPIQMVIGDRIQLGVLELELLANPELLAEIDNLRAPHVEETSQGPPQRPCAAERAPALLAELSPAELEIVVWMCRGYTNLQSIARQLYRSPHTVRTQLGSIFRKTGVHSRDGLVGWLRRATADNGDQVELLRRFEL